MKKNLENPSQNDPENSPLVDIIALKKKFTEIVAEDLDGSKIPKAWKFGKKLLQKYPDARDYKVYHILIGSTVESKYKDTDFPGEDSIVKFINSL